MVMDLPFNNNLSASVVRLCENSVVLLTPNALTNELALQMQQTEQGSYSKHLVTLAVATLPSSLKVSTIID
jgi:hypothetical protein